MPFQYRFADRVVVSAIELPALPIASGLEVVAAPASGIAIGPPVHSPRTRRFRHWLHVWQDDSGEAGMRVRGEPSHCEQPAYRLRVPGLADFIIAPGSLSIGIEPRKRTDPDTLEHLLLDQVLPRVLAASGELVVHASAAVIEGRAALFLGRSGWGKSTLAGMMAAAGNTPLSDDCLLVRPANGEVSVLGTYPSLRLNPDSLRHLHGEKPASKAVAYYTEKQRVQAASPGIGACPAAAIYLIEEPGLDAAVEASIRPLPPPSACMALLEHGFRLDLGNRAETTRTLELAAAVSRCLPAFSLAYPRDYGQRDALVAAITRHCASLTAAGG